MSTCCSSIRFLIASIALGLPALAYADVDEGSPASEVNDGGHHALPLTLPERPFLLLEAPRRFLPTEQAEARVQLVQGGRVQLAVYRVLDPSGLLAAGRWRQGVSIAQTPLGVEAERLLAGAGRLPRRGARLELVTVRAASVRRATRRRGRLGADETPAYDSNEEEESDVETWGVHSGDWTEARVLLGRLASGVYLVRAHAGPFASAALLSVGEVTMLVRRGDVRDTVLVTDPAGRPVRGVDVSSWSGRRRLATAETDADGIARFESRDEPTLRFIAIRGNDRTWSDVTHARLATCDPIVYLGVDRPVFRTGETIHLRGNVRGCPRDEYRPLANELVRVWPARRPDQRGGDEPSVDVRTDRDGNFVVELVARGQIGARVRGVTHTRAVQIDARSLPDRTIEVRVDRTWAAAGQAVGVTVQDAEGGWPTPAEVTLETPSGRMTSPIGPGRAATFTVRMPPTADVLSSVSLVATLPDRGTVTTARTEVWTGARPELLHLESDRAVAAPDEEIDVLLRASDLGGASVAGNARVEVVGSDGNRAVGAVRWRADVPLASSGPTRPRVRLVGAGPWLVRASMRGASATMIVWDRPRPPPLSARGALAVRPTTLVAQPGQTLDVDLRLPDGAGGAWLTLEQGTVWTSTMARRAGNTPITRASLSVPPNARGLATLVASFVRGGRVSVATATVEIETSRALALRVQSDRTSYDQGANARVTIEARGVDGRPRDAVVSVWVSDAGYFDLGEDTYPLPREMFRLPGRSASAGDGSIPVAYGADEGRHVDAFMDWNGAREPRMTFRHAWAFGGDLVRVDRAGGLADVATVLARAAGLSRARVCDSAAQTAGRVRLRVQDLPWDMVAVRIAEHTETTVFVERGVLVFSCDAFGSGSGMGSGYGSGSGALRTGSARIGGPARQERLEGTLRFIGLLRLGEDGREVVDLRLPNHPGRWRTEVLAIADDGGGDRSGITVSTARPLVVGLDLPSDLVLGDVARGAIRISAPSLAGQVASLGVDVPAGLEVLEAPPARVTLDAGGRAIVPITLRGSGEGPHSLATAARVGTANDAIRRGVVVRPSSGTQPLALSAVVGPRAAEIRVPLPELAAPARLSIELDAAPVQAIEHELHQLAEPRWNLPSMRLDRLTSLVALRDAIRESGTPDDHPVQSSVETAISSQLAAIDPLRAVDDGIGWWTHGASQSALTAELAWNTLRVRRNPGAGVWAFLASRVERQRLSPHEVPIVAAALAGSRTAAHTRHAATLLASLDGVSGDDLHRDTWALRAAIALRDATRIATIAGRLRGSIERALEPRPSSACAGPAWFLCFGRWGTRGLVARATRTLVEASAWRPAEPARRAAGAPPAAPVAPVVDPAATRAFAARTADWLGIWPAERSHFTWGSGEAEVIGLLASLGARSDAASRFTVTLDGRRIAAGNGRGVVTVPNGRDLVVRFTPSAGRAAILRVRGELRVAPPPGNVGPASLTRRFELGEQGWSLIVGFELPRDTAHVELGVPMPAGVSVAGSADRAALSIRSSSDASWRVLDDTRAAGAPRVELDDGAIRVRWRDVRSGRHEIRVPLVAVSSGEFRAAPGWLHTSDDRAWGLTPDVTVRVDPSRAASP